MYFDFQRTWKLMLSNDKLKNRDLTSMIAYDWPELRTTLESYVILLRKEVIQPQVPLRLPCYDFTPVAHQTLGACLPERLAQQLLVQSTPMVWRAVCTRPGNVFTAACWSAITSDSDFMESSCRLQSELRLAFWDLLPLASSLPSVLTIVARVKPRP